MIYDSLDNITLYARVHPFMPRVERFLASVRADTLDEGKFPIQGNDLFYLVQRYATKKPGEVRFESHRRYVDIQCVLSGQETVYLSQTSDLVPASDYDSQKDIRFYEDDEGQSIILRPGMFAVFFPHDAHKPNCYVGTAPGTVLKLVFKLAM